MSIRNSSLRALRLASRTTTTSLRPSLPLLQRRALATVTNHHNFPTRAPSAPTPVQSPTIRAYASSSSGRSPADQIAEHMQQMYAEAKDEFEIAVESTEGNALYAQSDRDATREELEKLKKAWEEAIRGEGELQEELKRRPIGQRIRELENAVDELDRSASGEA